MPVFHCKPCNVKRLAKGIEDSPECRYCGCMMDYFDSMEILESLLRKSSVQALGQGETGRPPSQVVTQSGCEDNNLNPKSSATTVVQRNNAFDHEEVPDISSMIPPIEARRRYTTSAEHNNSPGKISTDHNQNRGNSFSHSTAGSNQASTKYTIEQHAQSIGPDYLGSGGKAMSSTDNGSCFGDGILDNRNPSIDRRRERSPRDCIHSPPKVRERSPLSSRGRSHETGGQISHNHDQPQQTTFVSRSPDSPVSPTGQRRDRSVQVASDRQPQPIRHVTGGHKHTTPLREPPPPQPIQVQPCEEVKNDTWCLLHHTMEHVQGSMKCSPRMLFMAQVVKGIRLRWINGIPTGFGEQSRGTPDAVSLFNQVYRAKQTMKGFRNFYINRDFIFENVLIALQHRLSTPVVTQFRHFMGRANRLCDEYVYKSDFFLEEHIDHLVQDLREHPELLKSLKQAPDRSSVLEGLFWLDTNGTPFQHPKAVVKALRKTLLGISSSYLEAKMLLATEIQVYLDNNREIRSDLRSAWIESVFRSTFEAQPRAVPVNDLGPSSLQVTEWPSLQDTAKECIDGRDLPAGHAELAKYHVPDYYLGTKKSEDDGGGMQSQEQLTKNALPPMRMANVIKSEVKMEDGC